MIFLSEIQQRDGYLDLQLMAIQTSLQLPPLWPHMIHLALSVGGDSNCSGVVALLEKWMSRFGGTQHIMAGHQMKNIEIPILHSSARVAARLNYLCPQFFPAPGFWSLHKQNGSTIPFTNEDTDSKLCETISAENLLKFRLRPHAQLGNLMSLKIMAIMLTHEMMCN